MKQKISFAAILMLLILLLTACAGDSESTAEEEIPVSEAPSGYVSITAKEAKQLMDTEKDYIIIDARTQEEYDVEHIPGAIMIPEYEIADRAEAELPDKNHCRNIGANSARAVKRMAFKE